MNYRLYFAPPPDAPAPFSADVFLACSACCLRALNSFVPDVAPAVAPLALVSDTGVGADVAADVGADVGADVAALRLIWDSKLLMVTPGIEE